MAHRASSYIAGRTFLVRQMVGLFLLWTVFSSQASGSSWSEPYSSSGIRSVYYGTHPWPVLPAGIPPSRLLIRLSPSPSFQPTLSIEQQPTMASFATPLTQPVTHPSQGYLPSWETVDNSGSQNWEDNFSLWPGSLQPAVGPSVSYLYGTNRTNVLGLAILLHYVLCWILENKSCVRVNEIYYVL